MSNPFISLEDEITLRLSVRAAYKHEGLIGICYIMGELSRSLQIVGDIAEEILAEEKKNKGGPSNV
jgi:hypothetical protein